MLLLILPLCLVRIQTRILAITIRISSTPMLPMVFRLPSWGSTSVYKTKHSGTQLYFQHSGGGGRPAWATQQDLILVTAPLPKKGCVYRCRWWCPRDKMKAEQTEIWPCNTLYQFKSSHKILFERGDVSLLTITNKQKKRQWVTYLSRLKECEMGSTPQFTSL
jgi:hypothetical protein